MRTGLRALAGVVGLIGLLSADAASARNAMSFGGEGGGEFAIPCRGKRALVGLAMRSGSALDSVAPMCAEVRADRTVGPPEALGATGGGGGAPQTRVCGPNAVVTALRVHRDRSNMVNGVDLVCFNIISKDVDYVLSSRGGRATAFARVFCAPNQEWGTGIFGRSGSLIDKLGIQCERTETILPAASPPPVERPPQSVVRACLDYADEMATTSFELRRGKCDASGLSASLTAADKQVHNRFCLGLKGAGAATLASNLSAVKAKLASCKGGGTTGGDTGQKTTRATTETDIYDKPPPTNGGKDDKKVIGSLKPNQQTKLVTCRSDKWCQVTQGWVWGEHINPGAN